MRRNHRGARGAGLPQVRLHASSSDEDVLDTLFSSALWPFSTLGWLDETGGPQIFLSRTSMLVTGYDIIFFWVARMIFSGIEQMGDSPFDTVLIHGLVRDAQGRKMSKSRKRRDPLEVIDKYTDALRFAGHGRQPRKRHRYSDEKVESARNLANKVERLALCAHAAALPHVLEGSLKPASFTCLS